MEAAELFENTMAWLQEHYGEFRFFAERDVVWTVQRQIIREIEDNNLPYRVFNEFPIVPGTRRSKSADLVILNDRESVEVAIEFKYEPSPARKSDRGGDIWRSKIESPVVSWPGVVKDIERVRKYVEQDRADIAYAVLIDEGGRIYRSHPQPPQGSEWIDWGQGRWVLWTQASRG